MKKISIIIPVYNIEKYIEECILSILNQTYKNFELILINDGSKDKSGEICDKFKKDSRVKIFHKKNGGVSSARNIGIENATGEYLLFVDGDDCLEKNTLEVIKDKIENNDMLIYGYKEKYVKKEYNFHMTENEKIENSYQTIQNVVSNKYGGYIFNKVFKKSIILKENLRFNTKIHMCEDMLFVINYLKHCNNIKIVENIMYIYRMRKTSAVWQKNEKYFTIFDAYDQIEEELKKLNISTKNLDYKRLFSLFLLPKNKQHIIEEKKGYNKKSMYQNIINKNQFTKSNKIKLMIVAKLKPIYFCYMFIKTNKNKRYQ